MAQNSPFKCILLVDDNEVDNMVNLRMMEKSNFAENIFTFTSGKGALEFFKNIDRISNFPENLIPQIIFLDINMPVMNGFAFIKAINKLSKKITDNLRIVLLSQSDSPQDIKQAKTLNYVVEYVVKPLNEAKLKELKI